MLQNILSKYILKRLLWKYNFIWKTQTETQFIVFKLDKIFWKLLFNKIILFRVIFEPDNNKVKLSLNTFSLMNLFIGFLQVDLLESKIISAKKKRFITSQLIPQPSRINIYQQMDQQVPELMMFNFIVFLNLSHWLLIVNHKFYHHVTPIMEFNINLGSVLTWYPCITGHVCSGVPTGITCHTTLNTIASIMVGVACGCGLHGFH